MKSCRGCKAEHSEKHEHCPVCGHTDGRGDASASRDGADAGRLSKFIFAEGDGTIGVIYGSAAGVAAMFMPWVSLLFIERTNVWGSALGKTQWMDLAETFGRSANIGWLSPFMYLMLALFAASFATAAFYARLFASAPQVRFVPIATGAAGIVTTALVLVSDFYWFEGLNNLWMPGAGFYLMVIASLVLLVSGRYFLNTDNADTETPSEQPKQ